MKRKFWLVVGIVLVLAASVCTAEAARTIPASNETSTLIVGVSASADGGLRARTDAVFQQGNQNLNDNPPLNSSGEGAATIVYQEHTMPRPALSNIIRMLCWIRVIRFPPRITLKL
jgi:hypothetical protein